MRTKRHANTRTHACGRQGLGAYNSRRHAPTRAPPPCLAITGPRRSRNKRPGYHVMSKDIPLAKCPLDQATKKSLKRPDWHPSLEPRHALLQTTLQCTGMRNTCTDRMRAALLPNPFPHRNPPIACCLIHTQAVCLTCTAFDNLHSQPIQSRSTCSNSATKLAQPINSGQARGARVASCTWRRLKKHHPTVR